MKHFSERFLMGESEGKKALLFAAPFDYKSGAKRSKGRYKYKKKPNVQWLCLQ